MKTNTVRKHHTYLFVSIRRDPLKAPKRGGVCVCTCSYNFICMKSTDIQIHLWHLFEFVEISNGTRLENLEHFDITWKPVEIKVKFKGGVIFLIHFLMNLFARTQRKPIHVDPCVFKFIQNFSWDQIWPLVFLSSHTVIQLKAPPIHLKRPSNTMMPCMWVHTCLCVSMSVCVWNVGPWEVKAERGVSIFMDHMEILLCVCVSRQITGDPNGRVCAHWMVCVCALGGMVLWPRAYGEPLRRRFPSNTHIHPLGLWFVNELLYWLAS